MGIKRGLGQKFILDKEYLRSLVALSEVTDKNILEVGSGKGTLTEILLDKGKKIISVEIDNRLCEGLKNKFSDELKLLIVPADFLKLDISMLKGENWVFFANIPYYITTPIIEKLIENNKYFENYYLMVQYEVARRLFASEGNKDYGSLSIFFSTYFTGRILKKVPRTVFSPIPKVDSAFITFKNDIKADVDEDFFRMIRFIFSQRRKMIVNSLTNYFKNLDKNDIIKIFKKVKIDENQRPEQIPYKKFLDLYNVINSN